MPTIVDIDIEIDIDIIISIISMSTEDDTFSDIQTFFKFPTVDFFAGSLFKCQPEVH